MFKTKAIPTEVTKSELPPCERKGKVTPVDGISPEIPPMLTKTCISIKAPTPSAIIELNGFLALTPTIITRRMRKKRRARIKPAPIRPNSSITIENTKSVVASGR